MALDDKQLRALLLALAETRPEEINCEQFLGLMAYYAELRAEERPLPEALAHAEAHERLCASCREECEALVALLRQPPGAD